MLITSIGHGQDIRKEFIAMNEHLATLNNYRLDVDYSAGEGEEGEQGKVSVVVDPRGLFYHLGEAKMIINNKNTILIDDKERMLVYSDNQRIRGNESFLLTDNLIKGIDSLVDQSDTITFFLNQGVRTYNLRFVNRYFDLVQLEFEKEVLSKVIYYYNEDFVDSKGLVATCNMTLSENITFDPLYFQTAFYLTDQNGTMVPSENFNNYLIIYNEALEGTFD